MEFLFVVKKVSSGKRKDQVWNVRVTVHIRRGSLQKLQILHFDEVEIV